jgi:hypothetical protein
MEENELMNIQLELSPTHPSCGLCVVKSKTLNLYLKGWKKKSIRTCNLNSHRLTHHVVYVWLCASVIKGKTLKIYLKGWKKKSIRTYNLNSHPLTHHVVYVWLCASVVKSKTLNLYLKGRKKKKHKNLQVEISPTMCYVQVWV